MFDMMDYMDDMMRIENGWRMEAKLERQWFSLGDEEDDEIPENEN